MSRPSGVTLLTCALIVLLPGLAVLQYRWVGQVSAAERERMQHNLQTAAAQFREAFDGELARASMNVQVGAATARESSFERYAERYSTWLNTAAHPEIVASVFLVDETADSLRLRRWNADARSFELAEWPRTLAPFTTYFEDERQDAKAGRFSSRDRRSVFADADALVVTPLRNLAGPMPSRADGSPRPAPIFGFSIMELNTRYIVDQMLPELAERYFIHAEDTYRVAVTTVGPTPRVVYRSDPDAPINVEQADATASFFLRGDPAFMFRRGGSRRGSMGRDAGRVVVTGLNASPENESATALRSRAEDFDRWRLVVQHQSGSLETAVTEVRHRNLALSFGMLLLLSVSVGMLTVTSRRAQRLARQQIEFVAGVSHELRTPVAVIRSAAENLSHGVISSGDRVKRYGEMIESEARRLGETVEQVLQYSGIESGVGVGAREPLLPADVVDSAIESSRWLFSGDDTTVQREVAAELPAIVGDAAALRSAIQNLIANAVKYGGADKWVGIRAERVREGRRSEVRITVSDHGAGIPAAELPHIFEPFYRGADAVARQVHGNGLGLSLVKRIVTAHGGRITVTTRASVGSSFAVSLPVAEPDTQSSSLARKVSAPAHS